MLRIGALLLGISLLLMSCGGPEARSWYDKLDQINSSPEALENALSGATLITRDPNSFVQQHGTQVEYHAVNGKSYLWYPGNQSVVTGEWRTQQSSRGQTQVCYRYGPSTYNPVTQQAGGSWTCNKRYFQDSEFLNGNPFGLRAGRVPFVIPDKGRYYAPHFANWLGGDPARINYRIKPAFADSLVKQIEAETQ